MIGTRKPLTSVQNINERITENAYGGRRGPVFCQLIGQPESRERIIRSRTRKRQLQAKLLNGNGGWVDVAMIWQE